jgi:hypothetical protein
MPYLSKSKQVLAVLGAGLLLTTAGGTAFAMQSQAEQEAHPAVEVQPHWEERHGQPPTPVFASPLPTPDPTEAPEDHGRHEQGQPGNVNSHDDASNHDVNDDRGSAGSAYNDNSNHDTNDKHGNSGNSNANRSQHSGHDGRHG